MEQFFVKHDILKCIFDKIFVTAQKRTSRSKKFVAFHDRIVMKGPYKKRNEIFDYRTAIMCEQFRLGAVLFPGGFYTDKVGNGWYVFPRHGNLYPEFYIHRESERISGKEVAIAKTPVVGTGIDLWKRDKKAFEAQLEAGIMRTLIAFRALGVGDVQLGSNMMVLEGNESYLIDYEENSGMSNLDDFPLEECFLKTRRCHGKEFHAWFTDYLKRNKQECLFYINAMLARKEFISDLTEMNLEILKRKFQELN